MLQFIMLVLLGSAANGLGTSLWYGLGGDDPLRHGMGRGKTEFSCGTEWYARPNRFRKNAFGNMCHP